MELQSSKALMQGQTHEASYKTSRQTKHFSSSNNQILATRKVNQQPSGAPKRKFTVSNRMRPSMLADCGRNPTVPLCFYLVTLITLQLVVNSGQSALLTNLYGKKLSELTNFANSFLIIPSNRSADYGQNSDTSSATDGSGETVVGAEQSLRGPNENSVLDQVDQQQNDAPAPASVSPDNQLPVAEAWHSPEPIGGLNPSQMFNQVQVQASQQRQSSKSSRLFAQQQFNNNGSSSSGVLAESNRVPPGEPVVLESISTEFPNPNTNNLGHEITKILRKFFLHGYDKRVRPNYSGPPALVNVSFHIIGISSVDEVQMDFTTDFYFRQKWFDPRLEFDPVGEVDELCVGAEFAEKIWLPDTFFANEKTATFHKATTENTFIRIGHNGRVYRSIRLTVTCSCPMDLQYFPMDRQRCKIEIESYGYNTRDIDYRWEKGDSSVSLNTKIELPQFKILGFKMGQEIQNLSSGDYIRLYCEIHFVRSMGYYLIQIYIPASLIVMISWVSFWLHRNATPARVALGVTTVLTMTTLMSSTNAALPKISYIKSIDVFLGTCFVMVFAALLEYASVGYIGKRIAMKRKRLQDLQQMQQHHQRVCVAAAASAAAAAAAAAAQETNGNHLNGMASLRDSRLGNAKGDNSLVVSATAAQQLQGPIQFTDEPNATRTLHRKSSYATRTMEGIGGSLTLHRNSKVTSGDTSIINGSNNNETTTHTLTNGTEMHSAMKPSKRGTRLNPISPAEQSGRTPLLAAGAAMAAAASQPSHGPTNEFEVSQTHDMISICGLTPSAIDKHSRVVFPICFVCFNLMYWIIYGHISQQIEDKGPPLIPFIKG